MSQFVLLLHESPPDYSNVSAEEIQYVIGEYTAWRQKLEKEGRFSSGHKLKDEGGRHLSMQKDRVRVVDGPYAEAKEIMGGYFIIQAASYDEAVEISKECPHLKFGGRIELREIDQV